MKSIGYSQHRIAVEVERQQQEQVAQGHIDHIMKSGFTMSDIKGMHRYGEDNVEADEGMMNMSPSRSTRKGSVSRGSPIQFDMMERSASVLDMDFQVDEEKSEKKRGRSPFKFFKKSRDHSKDKHKSKSPSRGRGTCKIFNLNPYRMNMFSSTSN